MIPRAIIQLTSKRTAQIPAASVVNYARFAHPPSPTRSRTPFIQPRKRKGLYFRRPMCDLEQRIEDCRQAALQAIPGTVKKGDYRSQWLGPEGEITRFQKEVEALDDRELRKDLLNRISRTRNNLHNELDKYWKSFGEFPPTATKPAIVAVPESERLFQATAKNEFALRKDVQMLSFYHFQPVEDPKAVKAALEAAIASSTAGPRPLCEFAGTIYIAPEGMNGQFSVVEGHVDAFREMLSRACTDGIGVFPEGFLDLNLGLQMKVDEPAPFKKFKVVARKQILTDGLPSSLPPLDWQDPGPELSPSDWHQQISNMLDFQRANPDGDIQSAYKEGVPTMLLDCRNDYETDVGTFAGALPLNTKKFSDSWDELDRLVEDLPKDANVLAFCTGGIRCVKVGAYLRQKHGLTNVNRLEHGIIGYERWAEESAAPTDPTQLPDSAPDAQRQFSHSNGHWLGTNFVFDLRTGHHHDEEHVSV